MIILFVEPVLSYFTRYPILNSLAHLAAGFGLAVVLQHYLKGDAFISVYVGWLLIAVAVALHALAFIKR